MFAQRGKLKLLFHVFSSESTRRVDDYVGDRGDYDATKNHFKSTGLLPFFATVTVNSFAQHGNFQTKIFPIYALTLIVIACSSWQVVCHFEESSSYSLEPRGCR